MTESSNPQPRPAPEDLYWGISYLREDIQDLRNQIGAVHHRIDETNRSLGEQIQAVHHRIDETNRSLGEQIQAVHHRIDETNRSLGEQIQAVHHRIDETNKRMDTHFRWTMTTLVAITGILIAVIKL